MWFDTLSNWKQYKIRVELVPTADYPKIIATLLSLEVKKVAHEEIPPWLKFAIAELIAMKRPPSKFILILKARNKMYLLNALLVFSDLWKKSFKEERSLENIEKEIFEIQDSFKIEIDNPEFDSEVEDYSSQELDDYYNAAFENDEDMKGNVDYGLPLRLVNWPSRSRMNPNLPLDT